MFNSSRLKIRSSGVIPTSYELAVTGQQKVLAAATLVGGCDSMSKLETETSDIEVDTDVREQQAAAMSCDLHSTCQAKEC
eukprot:1325156-Rhodomonas_salina.1